VGEWGVSMQVTHHAGLREGHKGARNKKRIEMLVVQRKDASHGMLWGCRV